MIVFLSCVIIIKVRNNNINKDTAYIDLGWHLVKMIGHRNINTNYILINLIAELYQNLCTVANLF